jgi:hypothetical protein
MLDRNFVVAYSGNSEIVVCGMIIKNRSLPSGSTTRTPPGLRAAAMAFDLSRSNSSIVIVRRFRGRLGGFGVVALRVVGIVNMNVALRRSSGKGRDRLQRSSRGSRSDSRQENPMLEM